MHGLRSKFLQGFPPMEEFVRLFSHPMGFLALGRPTSWQIYLSASPRVCWPLIKFGQGFPPMVEFVRMGVLRIDSRHVGAQTVGEYLPPPPWVHGMGDFYDFSQGCPPLGWLLVSLPA